MSDKQLREIPEGTPVIRVQLTPKQRESVKKRTGRDMEYFLISDPDGDVAKDMANKRPDDIELLAQRKADRLNKQETLDAELGAKVEQDAKDAAEAEAKGQAAIEASKGEAEDLAEAITAAFAVEGQAAEIAREEAQAVWAQVPEKVKKKRRR